MDEFYTPSTRRPLVKHTLAAFIRKEILQGRLVPGEPIVEVKWARRLNVAQASVREALNILIAEGFVQKQAGRSASVTRLHRKQISQIYEVRSALEGLAARLIVARRSDLADLDDILAEMEAAASSGDIEGFYRADLRFHISFSEKSGNDILVEELRRLIVPLFAFVVVQVHPVGSDSATWQKSVVDHRHMLEIVNRIKEPSLAEQLVAHAIRNFGSVTIGVVDDKENRTDLTK